MVVKPCARCGRESLINAYGLCESCYKHRLNHKNPCSSCGYYNFDYDEYMKVTHKRYWNEAKRIEV